MNVILRRRLKTGRGRGVEMRSNVSEILCRGGSLVPYAPLEQICTTDCCMLTVQTAERRRTQSKYSAALLHQLWLVSGRTSWSGIAGLEGSSGLLKMLLAAGHGRTNETRSTFSPAAPPEQLGCGISKRLLDLWFADTICRTCLLTFCF